MLKKVFDFFRNGASYENVQTKNVNIKKLQKLNLSSEVIKVIEVTVILRSTFDKCSTKIAVMQRVTLLLSCACDQKFWKIPAKVFLFSKISSFNFNILQLAILLKHALLNINFPKILY